MRVVGLVLWAGCAGAGVPPVDTSDTAPVQETDAVACDPAVVGTWETLGEGYVRTWCSPCHAASLSGDARGGAPEGVDFDSLENVRRWAEAIAASAVGVDGAAPRMPPGGGPSSEDVAAFAAWLACEAPGTPEPADPCAVASVDPVDRTLASADEVAAFCAEANTVGGNLTVATDAPIDCLCDVYGDVTVTGAVTTLDAPRLRGIGGALRLGVPGLRTVALPALRGVSGALDLSGAGDLVAFDVSALRDVAGDLWVEGDVGLEALVLPELASVGGEVRLVDVTSLKTVSMPRLLDVGGRVTLSGLGSWDAWDDFASLTTVGGDLVVAHNPALPSVEGLDQLTSVGGDLVFADLGALEALSGLRGLATVAGSVRVVDNPVLRGVEGFLGLAVTDKALEVARNPSLVAVDGFAALERVGVEGDWVYGDHRLAFYDLPSLTRLPRFEALVRVGGFEVLRADALDTLDFPVLLIVDRDLAVVQVGGLRTLAGLSAVRRIGTDVAITGNPMLTAMDVQAFLDGVGEGNIGGTVTAQNNGP
jgi:hypothetical protein